MGHLSAIPQPRRNLIILRRHRLRAIRVRARVPCGVTVHNALGRYTAFDLLHETGGTGEEACGGHIGVRPTLIRDDLPLIFVVRRTEIVREMEQVL